jgi:hypothetical protein
MPQLGRLNDPEDGEQHDQRCVDRDSPVAPPENAGASDDDDCDAHSGRERRIGISEGAPAHVRLEFGGVDHDDGNDAGEHEHGCGVVGVVVKDVARKLEHE